MAKWNPRGKYEENGKIADYFGYVAKVNCERGSRANTLYSTMTAVSSIIGLAVGKKLDG